ncbi:hypothetical protein [Flavobacterium sp. ASV13]|uniref:hypothetical protein n=1 Tax=Flavobacterium sp. ASV13 TaxID=1506583 RepID=UPI00054E18F3|nr:hypothetical protein [Flavobacterium sp. ASV13]
MNNDWNWFFSSFCQSAAALIGIIGAFVISRLLGISEKINSTISEFDNLKIDYNKILLNIKNCNFYWCTKVHVKYNNDLHDQIKNGDFDNLSPEEILNKIYELDNQLFKIDEAVIESFDKVYEEYKPKYTPLGNGMSVKNLSFAGAFDIAPTGLWDTLSEQKSLIDKLEIESRTLIQHFERNLQNLKAFDDSTKPLKTIIILLLVAFPFTVIYPLHFMPMPTNSDPEITFDLFSVLNSMVTFKSVLLFIFFASIESIFWYFLFIINQLNEKLISAKEDNSEDLRTLENYSEHFK